MQAEGLNVEMLLEMRKKKMIDLQYCGVKAKR